MDEKEAEARPVNGNHFSSNYYIYIARLIIEHRREWLASLADYVAGMSQMSN